MKLTFLGTGTSHGIPVIGCSCTVCASTDPRDNRYRSAVLIEEGESALLVDAGPEFRLQALRVGLGLPGHAVLKAVLLTHAHADHIAGLDDLRPLTTASELTVYCNKPTLVEANEKYSYVFEDTQKGGGKPRFSFAEAKQDFQAGPFAVIPIPIMHGDLPILGWRIGPLAYLTDCSAIPDNSLLLLRGVHVLVLGALRMRPHATHFNVDQALSAARMIGARETWLTHICHSESHAGLETYCARHGADVGARPAWDGLAVEI